MTEDTVTSSQEEEGVEDFAAMLDAVENELGLSRARAMHIHFSTIEYTAAGEKRHRTFAEEAYGPRFQHLAPLLKQRGYAPRVICECKDTMAEDAKAMMEIYQALESVHSKKSESGKWWCWYALASLSSFRFPLSISGLCNIIIYR